jgi:hypothetical protein
MSELYDLILKSFDISKEMVGAAEPYDHNAIRVWLEDVPEPLPQEFVEPDCVVREGLGN